VGDMKLKNIIKSYSERGSFISETIIYNNPGVYPVYTSNTVSEVGYYSKYNYTITPYSYIYTLNGVKAGSILISQPGQKIWYSTDTGVFEIKPEFQSRYKKETVATYLQFLFMRNRHNNGGQPKFSLKRCLELEIEEDTLDFIEKQNNYEIDNEKDLREKIKSISTQLENVHSNNLITVADLLDSYKERGKRVTHGKDLYLNPGKYKVFSADIYGPMGYYNKYNYILKENSILYTIDGKNAGTVLTPAQQKIWLTDHAGVINIKQDYIDEFGKLPIAIYLQKIFKENRDGTGTRPQFLLKKVLNKKVNLDFLKILAQLNEKKDA
jgi:hypothetical protein